jgi:hypothetical protein
MPIIVSTSQENQIEVSIRYLDLPHGAIRIFQNIDDEKLWVEKEKEKISKKALEFKSAGDDVPEEYKKDPSENIKELKTWWKRTDWGTQSSIMKSSAKNGEIDWTIYRMEQMKSLMIGWNLKTAEGESIPINDTIIKRMDYNVALALISKYEEIIEPTEEELENLE